MDKKNLKIIKSKNENTSDFIEETINFLKDKNNAVKDCICIVIYEDDSSDCFYTRMNYSNLIGFIEANKQILIDEWLHE